MRRFRYKYNGKKDKRKRLPPAGSLKAVQAKRNSAADKLHRGAEAYGRYVCQLSFVENNQLLLPGQMLECMLAPDGPRFPPKHHRLLPSASLKGALFARGRATCMKMSFLKALAPAVIVGILFS